MTHRRMGYFLTALPFMAVFAAQDVRIATRVEDDGTGIRRVKIVAARERRDTIDKGMNDILPPRREGRSQGGVSGESYLTERDARFTDTTAFGDLKITRHTRLGAWPIFSTHYMYTDTIVRTAFTGTEREEGAAAQTEYQYVVTMPGVVDENSVSPPLGQVDGSTVTWKLKADIETQEVTVSSARAEWAPVILLAVLIVVGLFTGLRYLQYRRRTKPQKI